MNILIRTDGSVEIGNGHMIRMIALADELILRNFNIIFLIKKDYFWIKQLKKKYKVIKCDENNLKLFQILNKGDITHFIYDTRNDLVKSDFLKIRKLNKNLKIVVNDSPEEIRKHCDIFLSPPIAQIKDWDWTGFNGKIYSDWEYVMLRKEFHQINTKKESNKVLLSFGSTDPLFITEKVLDLLCKADNKLKQFEFILIVGPQFDRIKKIKSSNSFKILNIEIIKSPSNIEKLFNSVSFAIISFGVTAYELSLLKVPFMSISISDDHEKSSNLFVKNNLSKSLGLVENFEFNFYNIAINFINDLETKKISFDNFNNKISNWNKIIKVITA
jgi:spore coat polysaccharide biosynthesis protein SpsF